ncbi:MAG: DUF998 domain-containing protein [Sulfitobacter sp.]|nr:DUF998 domain-containing protein [Sulfitobacter sp.]
MPTSDRPVIASGFLRLMAVIAALGTAALLIGNIVGSIVVPDHDWISDTVSDLAAGRYEIIQDVALYGYAATLLALGLAAAHLHTGAANWGWMSVILVVLAAAVIVIGARNEYGDGDNGGVVIHIYVVYLLGALFAGIFALMAVEGGRFDFPMQQVSWVCLVFWAIGAPVFFVMPTKYDGAWERGLGVVTMVWCLAFALALWREAAEVRPSRARDDF